jgi:hypothetical protein
MSNKLIADLKNSSNTDIKNLLDNKVSSELGSMSNIRSITTSEIKSTEKVFNNIKNKISGVIANNLSSENNKTCINTAVNKNKIGNFDINTGNNKYENIDIKQSIISLSKCIFTTDVKNAIANLISNDLSNKTVNDQKTISDNTQISTTEAKGVGSMFKSILDGIGGVISSSMGIFLILGIFGLGFLYYMAKGGGNEFFKDMKK